MSKGYRTGGDGEDASAFDVSALLNFMYRCRLVDKYVYDFNSVKNVLQVRKADTLQKQNFVRFTAPFLVFSEFGYFFFFGSTAKPKTILS